MRFQLAGSESPDAPPADGWIDAIVPGGVHESLVAAGLLADPFVDLNEEAAAWVAERHWWYRATLEVADTTDRQRLVFHGLDTVVTAWIDGAEVARHETSHRPLVLDLAGTPAGAHDLLLRFDPPLADVVVPDDFTDTRAELRRAMAEERGEDPADTPANDLRKVFRRKAAFAWGWDFAPDLPAVGIWMPVELVVDRTAAIAGVYARTTSIEGGTATLAVDVEVDAFAGDATVSIEVTDPAGAVVGSASGASAVFQIPDAQLWWSHDLGAQPLYTVTTSLSTGARRTDRVGLRTIALDTSDDPAGGRFFRFLLNGVPTFARGANWVPPSMFYGSWTAEQTRAMVQTAVHGEMTMLRVWGGGVYPPGDFFDACDELGVLVWQDFMFACVDYPSENAAMQEEIRLEAEFQVRRLRNHASLALWCGNNEVQAIHWLVMGNAEPGNWGSRFFDEILPAAVAKCDPDGIYWPGSPWGEIGHFNEVHDGDRHAWEVWHGGNIGAGGPTEFASRGEQVHYHRYAYDDGKFISEFGLHASPELATLERWNAPGTLEFQSPAMLHRIKDTPKDKGYALLEFESGLPTTMAEYVRNSMAVQAEGMKFGVEHYRRRQPHCSGALVWQFNDPWPGISWSLVDYDNVPKAAYWFLQRTFAPLLVSFKQTSDALELWATNSGAVDVDLELDVEIFAFAGGSVVRESVPVTAAAYSSGVVWSGPASLADPANVAWVSERSGKVATNRAFFDHLKNLPLGEGRVSAKIAGDEVTVTATGFAYFVGVTCDRPGLVMDRNYVDVRDGETVTLRVLSAPEGAELRVSSWAGPAS